MTATFTDKVPGNKKRREKIKIISRKKHSGLVIHFSLPSTYVEYTSHSLDFKRGAAVMKNILLVAGCFCPRCGSKVHKHLRFSFPNISQRTKKTQYFKGKVQILIFYLPQWMSGTCFQSVWCLNIRVSDGSASMSRMLNWFENELCKWKWVLRKKKTSHWVDRGAR